MEKSFDKNFLRHLDLEEESTDIVSSRKSVDIDDDIDLNFRIGIKSFELFIPEAQSLKQKRFVIKSLKERMKSKFNVSVAETNFQDLWQRSIIVAVTISNDIRRIHSILSKLNEFVEHEPRLVVIDIKEKVI